MFKDEQSCFDIVRNIRDELNRDEWNNPDEVEEALTFTIKQAEKLEEIKELLSKIFVILHKI